MPRVSVEQEAIHDPRLSAAARRMPLRRPEVLGWRLLSVWSLVTYTQSTRQRRCVVAEALGMRDASHLDALVEVGLAEDADDVRDIELAPMSELFGGFAWLGELRASAPSGGRARAATATRDPATGQMTTRDYHSEILALLAEGPVRSRAALARALRADRARVGSVLDELLESGDVVGTDAGFALSPDDSSRTAAPDDNLPSGRTASALAPALAPSSALSLAEGVARAPAARPDDSSRTAAPDDNLQPPHDNPDDSHRAADTAAQPLLVGMDEVRPASVTRERALEEHLAKRVIGWLNELHRQHGRLQGHRGFDALARDVLQAARRWRKARLSPEEVIAVCEHRIAQWRALSGDWLDNCTPQVLFRPNKFDAALQEVRAGHTHTGTCARDIRFGAVEPSPETVYAGGEVQL